MYADYGLIQERFEHNLVSSISHHAPLAGKQIGDITGFQQGENLLFPLGAFLQEFVDCPFLLRQFIKQNVKQQEGIGSVEIVQTPQGGHSPSAGRFDQTGNLVTVAIKHSTRHLDKK